MGGQKQKEPGHSLSRGTRYPRTGAGPNGAVIHYRAQPGTCRTVDANTLLLVDSGAQFDCGTTDITRTMHYGTPTDYQKRCYTRVLQVHGRAG